MVVIHGGETECPVMAEWLKMEDVVGRASTKGNIALIRGSNIDRTTVADNFELLKPLVATLGSLPISKVQFNQHHMHVAQKSQTGQGMRPSLAALEDLVARFLFHCRPRGKPLPKGHLATISICRLLWLALYILLS